jgi:hypothetical protein
VNKRKRLAKILALSGGGFALLVLVVLCAIAAFVNDSNHELVGSWKGSFKFAFLGNVDCTYRFLQNGTMVDEHVDPDRGIPLRFRGRYTFAKGTVDIRWSNGGFERATVRRTGANSIEYVIVAHSDPAQIGGRATFNRAGP